MKISVKDIENKPKEKVFHPFVLEFKIESEEDLQDLWVRFNANPDCITENFGNYGYSATWKHHVFDELSYLLFHKPHMK